MLVSWKDPELIKYLNIVAAWSIDFVNEIKKNILIKYQ